MISSNSHVHDALVQEVEVVEEEHKQGLLEVHDVDGKQHVPGGEQDSPRTHSALLRGVWHQ